LDQRVFKHSQIEQGELPTTFKDLKFLKDDKWGYPYSISRPGKDYDFNIASLISYRFKELEPYLTGYTKAIYPKLGIESLMKFDTPHNCKHPLETDYANAWVRATARLRDKLTPTFEGTPWASLEDVGYGISNLSSSAGFSFPMKKKRDTIFEALHMAKGMMHRIKYGLNCYQPPSKVAFRGHLSDINEPKTRPVWVAPFELLIIEQLMGMNLIAKAKSLDIIHFGEDSMPKLSRLMMTDIEARD